MFVSVRHSRAKEQGQWFIHVGSGHNGSVYAYFRNNSGQSIIAQYPALKGQLRVNSDSNLHNTIY